MSFLNVSGEKNTVPSVEGKMKISIGWWGGYWVLKIDLAIDSGVSHCIYNRFHTQFLVWHSFCPTVALKMWSNNDILTMFSMKIHLNEQNQIYLTQNWIFMIFKYNILEWHPYFHDFRTQDVLVILNPKCIKKNQPSMLFKPISKVWNIGLCKCARVLAPPPPTCAPSPLSKCTTVSTFIWGGGGRLFFN